MDHLLLAAAALAGASSFGALTMRRSVSIIFALFAWLFAIPWLTVYVAVAMAQTGPWSLTTWTNEAEIGPVTLTLAVLGLSIWFMRGPRNVGT